MNEWGVPLWCAGFFHISSSCWYSGICLEMLTETKKRLHQPTKTQSWQKEEPTSEAPQAPCEGWDGSLQPAEAWSSPCFRAAGPCMTAVWTLKRGDNLISTHVSTTTGAKRKLRAYCGAVTSSYILWPQEWKTLKWLWCPGSGWCTQRYRCDWGASHLCALLSERVNEKNLACQRPPCWPALFWACLCTASNNVTFSSLAATNTSAGFMQERPRAAGRWQQLLSANLTLDIVAGLADR